MRIKTAVRLKLVCQAPSENPKWISFPLPSPEYGIALDYPSLDME